MTTNARSAEYIIDHDIPLNELTEVELESVIELKAEWRARDNDYLQAQKERAEAMADIIRTHAELAQKQEDLVTTLASEALASYKKTLEV